MCSNQPIGLIWPDWWWSETLQTKSIGWFPKVVFTIGIWASINKGQICSEFSWKAYYRFNIARVWRSVLFSLTFTPYLCILSSGSSLLKWARALWQSRPAGPLLIKSGIKQEAGSAVERCLGEGKKNNNTVVQGNCKLSIFAHWLRPWYENFRNTRQHTEEVRRMT